MPRTKGSKNRPKTNTTSDYEKDVPGNPLKAEYLIPIFVGEQLEQGKMAVKVLRTNDNSCSYFFTLLLSRVHKRAKNSYR